MAKLEWVLRESGTLVASIGKFKLFVYPYWIRPVRSWSVYEVRGTYDSGIADGDSATPEEGMDDAEQALADHLRQYVPLMQTLGVGPWEWLERARREYKSSPPTGYEDRSYQGEWDAKNNVLEEVFGDALGVVE